jgi:mono/diheme cytochrome c family protein
MRSRFAAPRRAAAVSLTLVFVAVFCAAQTNPQAADSPHASLLLSAKRNLPSDLEIGGELKDLPAGTTRYVTLDSLLALPLVTYAVTGDANFSSTTPTMISGIPLDDLAVLFGAKPSANLVVAICDDKYRTNYPRAYFKVHHPLLVLRINGEPPSRWPKTTDTHGYDMGPYMISHPTFTPSFKILSHTDEPQIPWGVVRLEFRNEATVFGAIAPRYRAGDASVQAGYKIAQQNCFKCHNAGDEGGQKAGRPWLVLAAFAATAPEYFSAYVRDPEKQNPGAQMPPNSTYDDATIRALRDYFATLAPATPREKQ